MKLLLLDSRPEEYYTPPLANFTIPGHNLEIQSNWPVVNSKSWAELTERIKRESDQFGVVVIHTSDVLSVFPTIPKALDQVRDLLTGFASGKTLLFFSGGGMAEPFQFELAMKDHTGIVRACALAEIKVMLKAFAETKDCSVFEVSPKEVASQALSALWALGLLWEKLGTREEAVGAWRRIDPSELNEFELQLQSYVYQIWLNPNQESFRSILWNEQDAKYGIFRRRLSKLDAEDVHRVVDELDHVLVSNNVADWNERIETLRCQWVGA